MKKHAKLHKIIFLGLLALLAVSLLAGCSSKEGDSGKEPYKIGAVLDISGASSSLGIPEKNTLEMEVEKINKKGGINGREIKLLVEDTKSINEEALKAAKKLIEQDKVLAIIGTGSSTTSMAIKDYVQSANIPMISLASSDQIVNPVKDRKFIFSTAQPVNVVAENIGAYLEKKNIKKVGFISVNNAFGDNGKTEFFKMAQKKGITIVAQERFGAQDSDMTTQLTKIKGANPQAIVVWATPPAATTVTKNYKTLGINVPLIHSHGVGNQEYIKDPAANGTVFPIGKIMVAEELADNDPQKANVTEYVNNYESTFNSSRSTFGGHAWDAIHMLEQAIGKAGADPLKIRDELEKLNNFIGVTGVFHYSATDHSGLQKDAQVMVEVKNNKLQIIE